MEKEFPGFLSREVIEPMDGGQNFYTLVVRFDSSANLSRWLDSGEWKGLYARLQNLVEQADRFGTDEQYLTPCW